ncbi:hypothetical protein CSW10_00635 [Mesomycoplasma dispar]|uniref:Uncharacterized protein n=1 Tax=Mesomycoplasma dispar TaxID=86660 RepID=A0ABN5DR46_9BACT|nr:hypothetical protein CSW10_00635 [Mesomycoplasma dispar]
MARHLSRLKWEKWFEKFKEFKKREARSLFWLEYFEFRKSETVSQQYNSKIHFWKRLKLYNLGMNLDSKSGKFPKKRSFI